MHLEDAFIQSDLYCIQGTVLILNMPEKSDPAAQSNWKTNQWWSYIRANYSLVLI